MKRENIKTGVVYQFRWRAHSEVTIGTFKEAGNDILDSYIFRSKSFGRGGTANSSLENFFELATPKQIHWYNECVKLNKFIPKSEAMETFKKEYVKIY